MGANGAGVGTVVTKQISLPNQALGFILAGLCVPTMVLSRSRRPSVGIAHISSRQPLRPSLDTVPPMDGKAIYRRVPDFNGPADGFPDDSVAGVQASLPTRLARIERPDPVVQVVVRGHPDAI